MGNTLSMLQQPTPDTDTYTIITSIVESSDLWTKTTSGTGALAWGETYLQLGTGGGINGLARVTKNPGYAPAKLGWTKKRKLRFNAWVYHDDDGMSEVYVSTGDVLGDLYGFGIRFTKNTIRAFCANGGLPSYLDLVTGLTPPWGEARLYELILTPGSNIAVYVDNVLVGQLTTNLPTGTTSSSKIIFMNAKAFEALGHLIRISGFTLVVEK